VKRARILTIRLPNPYFEKENNSYLIDAGELALIDTGIDTPESLSALQGALSQHGYKLEAIQKIFLTHKHMDHFGLARRLQDISGTEVYIHEDDYEGVARFEELYDHINRLYLEKMLQWGIPQQLIDIIAIRSKFAQFGRSVPADTLTDDQIIPIGDAELRVIHTPGHTQGSVCFLVEDALFTGDHLLADYTPNIGATEVTATGMLPKYRNSLRRIRKFSGLRILPGHGVPITDLSRRIDTILSHHEERQERILNILADGQLRTVYEIALSLFGTMREHHALLGSGEVQAHLEVLERERLVKRREDYRYYSPPRTSTSTT
jgi:glyoxylase-like metal-dependent hydrolase (beta-lactamase superfamily II)